MEKSTNSRRKFIKDAALGTAGISLAATGMSAKSYSSILGANDRLNFALAGLNSRGNALANTVMKLSDGYNTRITHICDVDSRVLEKRQVEYKKESGFKPKTYKDFRKMLESKKIDVFVFATPDHWHAPMGMIGLEMGKHIYIEKPCCHNPAEGEMLVAMDEKHKNLLVQMGNQQRSGYASQQAIKDIREGIIGEVYFGKAWYSNSRKGIGTGKKVAVPEWLDWELFQGPAPREEFRDNLVHYNWHWFWNWGTGEINNNGTHELDICRWALGVDIPKKVTSSGGRFHFQDDWEFYDTQVASYEFDGGKMITWEGKSCNSMNYKDRGRGVTIHGTEGSILLDRNKYIAYNMKGEVIKEMEERVQSQTTNIVGGGGLTDLHMVNLIEGIRKSVPLNAPIADAYKSNLLPHLGNIAQEHGQLDLDPKNGHIIGNEKAQQMWGREYEKGWEPPKA